MSTPRTILSTHSSLMASSTYSMSSLIHTICFRHHSIYLYIQSRYTSCCAPSLSSLHCSVLPCHFMCACSTPVPRYLSLDCQCSECCVCFLCLPPYSCFSSLSSPAITIILTCQSYTYYHPPIQLYFHSRCALGFENDNIVRLSETADVE